MRLLLLVLLVAVVGCKAGEGKWCTKAADCGFGLTCDTTKLKCVKTGASSAQQHKFIRAWGKVVKSAVRLLH